ncbi:uncharacterized protein LOC113473629 [Diaphorina citri]|uniref:Uncharacterized protein LOC113473629 n=1 Tax=Diaphorina citri TaxID=121845 RepID=A0A3Q0JQ24_DIACI|nr:uncharacterized protein LOC113473629 [Diaphorina citri]
MLKSNVINGTQFADLTKPNNSHTGSNRANLSKVTSNTKTRATHETNTRAKGSTRHQNSTGNTGSANGQTPRSRYSRYSPNSQYTRDEMQGRDGAKWRKGKGKGTQHVGRNKDSRVNRVFYNNTYRGPAYYPPPPPPFPDHYDYGFPPFPRHLTILPLPLLSLITMTTGFPRSPGTLMIMITGITMMSSPTVIHMKIIRAHHVV